MSILVSNIYIVLVRYLGYWRDDDDLTDCTEFYGMVDMFDEQEDLPCKAAKSSAPSGPSQRSLTMRVIPRSKPWRSSFSVNSMQRRQQLLAAAAGEARTAEPNTAATEVEVAASTACPTPPPPSPHASPSSSTRQPLLPARVTCPKRCCNCYGLAVWLLLVEMD